MDVASIGGILFGIAFMVFGIVQGDAGFSQLLNFFDVPSILITFGGSLTSLLTSYKLNEFFDGFKSVRIVFKTSKVNEGETITKIIELSNVARKEGLLALEEIADGLEDDFMKKGILLIVDGTEPDLVRGIMETELMSIDDRHKKMIGFWETWSALGPAWGMIGTLIGLINMLKQLDDAASIGPNMSVALVTTMYGSMIANWIAIPIANKMKSINASEYQMKEVMIEGLLSIQAGENPRVIEEKLKSFISPITRKGITIGETSGGTE